MAAQEPEHEDAEQDDGDPLGDDDGKHRVQPFVRVGLALRTAVAVVVGRTAMTILQARPAMTTARANGGHE